MRTARYLTGKYKTYYVALDEGQQKGAKNVQRRLKYHGLNFAELVRVLVLMGIKVAEEKLAAGVPLREWTREPEVAALVEER